MFWNKQLPDFAVLARNDVQRTMLFSGCTFAIILAARPLSHRQGRPNRIIFPKAVCGTRGVCNSFHASESIAGVAATPSISPFFASVKSVETLAGAANRLRKND